MAQWNWPSNSYGWEKLFSEELYLAHKRNYGLNVCITRFSTIYGPGAAFDDGREKAVAAICRKVLDAPQGGEIEVWGDGKQIRPLVYISDLLDAITGLVRSPVFNGPVNIANAEETTCNEVARQAIALSNKRLTIKNVPGPIGKQVLRMDTSLAEKRFGWKAQTPFSVGLERTFEWIARQKAK
jgi:nucleoside-diphosphate-sugar epimerase